MNEGITAAPGTTPGAASGGASLVRKASSTVFRVGGVFITVLVVMAVFAVLSEGKFLIPANLLGMLRAMSTIAIMGLGLLVVIVVGEIDLSFANLYGLCASTMAVLWISFDWPVWWAIVAAFAMAVFWGAFNAFFTSITKIPSFIATLGSATLIVGVTLFITNTNRYNYLFPDPGSTPDPGQVEFFRGLANQALPERFPMQAVWLVVIAALFWFLMNRSLFGFRLKAIGGNPEAARLARLPVTKYKFAAFIICSTMACLAALLDFSFIGSTQPSAGQSLLFPTFAAVIIGGASLSGGRGSVAGTLAGALLLAVLANGVALLAAGPFAQQVLLGTVTIGAVLLDQFTQRRRGLI
jgi:ribose/xylose/arabinose/galactoside ABC-type transport system permease subunit